LKAWNGTIGNLLLDLEKWAIHVGMVRILTIADLDLSVELEIPLL